MSGEIGETIKASIEACEIAEEMTSEIKADNRRLIKEMRAMETRTSDLKLGLGFWREKAIEAMDAEIEAKVNECHCYDD